MSEPMLRNGSSELASDTASLGDPDKTQPTQDILDVLRQLSTSQQTIPNSQSSENLQQHSQVIEPAASQQDPPPSEWDLLRAQVREKPADSEKWLKLVEVAEDSGDFERINETYEALLEAYPNTSSAQIAYINHILDSASPSKYQYAEGLFKRFLKTSPFVDLWKYYLSYVRKMNSGPNTRETVRKAYEFALNHIGQDKEATEIWTDYIQFLKAGESATTWDDGHKMDSVRKAYQRAVQIPMDNVKRIWEEYQEFENNLNKITAKKFISDLSVAHMQARTVLNQLQEHLTVLFPPLPPPKLKGPSIYIPRATTFSAGEKALVGRWRIYLKWEESNPLELEEKDRATLQTRIQGVYRKAVVRMRFFSEIWYMAYVWNINQSNDPSLLEAKRKDKKDEALSLLERGIEANPASFLLNFAYAEAQEASKSFGDVHTSFTKFLEVLRKELDELESRVNFSPPSSQESAVAVDRTDAPVGWPNASSASQNSSQNSQTSEGQPPKNKELVERRTEYGLAWIVYMRFARRAENLKSARAIFGKSRRDRWTPWQVYEAAALMEYHCTKATDVAMRIFEKGLENFSDEAEFALKYLGFLISINDDSNARALFERAVNSFSPERARPIWERWARYEYQFGNLEAAQILEKRMSDAYPNDPPIKRFAARHEYLGTDAIAHRDLGFVRGSSTGSSRSTNGVARTDTQQSLLANISPPSSQQQISGSVVKRPSSPEPRRRDEGRGGSEYGPPSKRQRGGSPTRSHDRERWDGPQRRRPFDPSASWSDRDRSRDGPPMRRHDKDREEDKGFVLPPVLSYFVGQLPPPANFDGPIFRTDDLMQVFRNAVIPSSTGIRPRSPPHRGGGRPPPDYSPYTGPGGSGRRGRY